MKISWVSVMATLAVTGVGASGSAFGQATLSGPSTILNSLPAPNCKTTANQPCAENYQFAPSTGTTNTFVTDNPTTYTFSDTFNQIKSLGTLSDFGATAYATQNCPSNPNCLNSHPLLTFNFQDNYDFTTPNSGPTVQGAVLSFAIPSFDVGLENVETRIVSFSSGQTAAQLIGSTQQGVMTVVDGWATLQASGNNPTLYTATLNSKSLSANTEYVLQVRGEALSTAASYTGSVTFEPVPLPAGLPLLVSGLSAFGLFRRRRSGDLAASA